MLVQNKTSPRFETTIERVDCVLKYRCICIRVLYLLISARPPELPVLFLGSLLTYSRSAKELP